MCTFRRPCSHSLPTSETGDNPTPKWETSSETGGHTHGAYPWFIGTFCSKPGEKEVKTRRKTRNLSSQHGPGPRPWPPLSVFSAQNRQNEEKFRIKRALTNSETGPRAPRGARLPAPLTSLSCQNGHNLTVILLFTSQGV